VNADRIVEVSTDLGLNTVTLIASYNLTDLTGRRPPDNATVPGAITVDVLPSLAVATPRSPRVHRKRSMARSR